MTQELHGFVGGIGSRASGAFARKAVESNLARKFVLINNPDINILHGTKEHIVATTIDTVNKLAQIGCTHVTLLCNTIHLHFDAIKQGITADIVLQDLILTCAQHIVQKYGNTVRVGLFGTKGVIASQLYQQRLASVSQGQATVVAPAVTHLDQVHNLILDIIQGKQHANGEQVVQLANVCFDSAAVDVIVLGCTDIGAVLWQLPSNMIDPLDCCL